MSRDTAILVALGALAVASGFASAGAWILLWRDRRARRANRSGED